MAMSINGKFKIDEINEDDLYQMSQSAKISGKLFMKEYNRIKDLLLTTSKKVLSDSVFPEKFKSDFYHHLQKTHSELLF